MKENVSGCFFLNTVYNECKDKGKVIGKVYIALLIHCVSKNAPNLKRYSSV